MSPHQVDLVVVGAGPAGVLAALRAAELGARTELIARTDFGGMAANDGPVPVRTLAHASRLMRDTRQLGRYGVTVSEPVLDYVKLLARVREVVEDVRSHSSLRQQIDSLGVTVREQAGAARFVDAHTVETQGGLRLRAEKIILCTGGASRRLPIPGFELTSTDSDAWALTSASRRPADARFLSRQEHCESRSPQEGNHGSEPSRHGLRHSLGGAGSHTGLISSPDVREPGSDRIRARPADVRSTGREVRLQRWDTYLLSALVNKLTAKNALEIARKELFAPLGITDVRWAPIDKQGVVTGEAGMRLTPHDMAKLGYLYLRDGVWDGKRIIPSAWVERARNGKFATSFGKYANLWWSVPDRDAFMALGRHGQLIVVLQKLDVVAVMTGVVPDNEKRYPLLALINHIVATVKSDKPLPPDREGEAALSASLLKAATEKATPVGAASDLIGAVSNKTWGFGDNELRIRAVGLNLAGETATFELAIYSDKPGGRDAILSEPIGLDGRSRGKRTAYAFVANRGS